MRDVELMKSWAQKHGLKPATGHPCLGRLVGKTCWVYRDSRYRKTNVKEVDCEPPKSDHASLWNKDGKTAAFVMQPYEYSGESIDWILAFCRKYRLELRISTDQSWHFPGRTTLFVIARRGVLASKKAVI